uniref:Uncharacterized protein n=1 Tax=Tanacetum cinerariifolium TaxID=118510 RepID=A0A699SNL5_TANCI|nr:hypothetical protein [Tanacetum cinerariifolium]
MSAVMMWMLLRYDGWAQFKAYVSLDGFLPAKAKVLRGCWLLMELGHALLVGLLDLSLTVRICGEFLVLLCLRE